MTQRSISYGPGRAQVLDLWRPVHGVGDLPVVVFLHGGFWRQIYTKRLMHGLARAVVAHGWIAANVEYRRVGARGKGGWPATFDDVSAAVDVMANVAQADLDKVVTCGHSAGGQLALWAGGPRSTSPGVLRPHRVRPCAAISLAGVVDLVAAATGGLGGGAVEALMGGSPDEYPDRYALGSPADLVPLGIAQYLIHGLGDTIVPAWLSAAYTERAAVSGDNVTYLPLTGVGHMEMIDPNGPVFPTLLACLDEIAEH